MNNDKKKQAFDKAVNDTVHCLFEYHRENMNNADNPTEYIKDEISYLDQCLNKNMNILFMIRTGTYDYSGFTDSLCDEILSSKEPQKWPVLWTEIKNGKVISRKDNQFYKLAIELKLKDKYKILLKEVNGSFNIDVEKLQILVSKANDFLTNEPDKFRTLKSGAFISNDLKEELSNEFNMGMSTIDDWLKKHCEKEQHLFRIKPEVLASLKSE